MSAKYSFNIRSSDRTRALPAKIIIGQSSTETIAHVMLKFLAYLLFYRERLQIESNLHIDSIQFVPDLVQLDYESRPALWVECGDCGAAKLHKLAVKVPDAAIWVMKRSRAELDVLVRSMAKMELRRDRYDLLALDSEMFDELCELAQSRNEIFWVSGSFDPPQMQFDFNGLWFDSPFHIQKF